MAPFALAILAALTTAAPASAKPRGVAASFPVKTVLELPGDLTYGDYVWDDDGVAPGPLTIVVDLDNELLHVYRGGNEIGRSVIIYGDDKKPTPMGEFHIIQRDIDHVSNIYKGAPMPYMLKLTTDGVAIHGSKVEVDTATHGCVGLPDEFAAMLYSQAKLGDRVLITNDWMDQFEPM
ncbi:L,D-transpeptidase family protein [Sphingomonadaceae bacterium LXI357]|uniref:L,D-transpeptidase family protein n=2 Tax=Stakelama marina TaxID=2826939 RepID=A0A8T4IHG1_9SPHN|nr:L,D-transpeptidase family protein [Stakelama marina]